MISDGFSACCPISVDPQAPNDLVVWHLYTNKQTECFEADNQIAEVHTVAYVFN